MDARELTPVPGAETLEDEDGRPIIRVATCGTCGRSWNDAAVSSRTPAPAGRCPFEDVHEDEDEDEETCADRIAAAGFERGYAAAIHDVRVDGSRAHAEIFGNGRR